MEVYVQHAPGDGIRISVLDRGPGAPEDQLDTVLQPFLRLGHSQSRYAGGTGLGLAIAQQLVGVLSECSDFTIDLEGDCARKPL
ncbi:ATP-binding protein [Pseudaminobacter soli (ex Li et al. 2025)]|uniref:ATP-binding protein n=1 Tax=Pseudaminobacter soli (ex Li et al. 2025) TaxID=1295366 RepID=UPI003CD0521E